MKPTRQFIPSTLIVVILGVAMLTEARVVVGDYRQEYNRVRPHSRLGYESPAVFAARSCPSPVPLGLRPHSTGDGQTTNKNINSNQGSD